MNLFNKFFFYSFRVILILFVFQSSIYAKDIEFPLIQSFTHFPYSENSGLKKGKFETEVNLYHSNIFTFNKNDNIMNDFALTSVTFGFRYGITDRFVAELYLKYGAITGGIMDGFIESFHSFFGLPDAYRPDYPRDIIKYYNNSYFIYENNTGAMFPIVFSLMTELYSDNNFSIRSRFGLGIPVKSKPGFSSDKVFLTAGIIGSYKIDNLKIELSNYISWFKEPEWFSVVNLVDKIYFAEIRITYKRFLTGFIFKTSPLIEGESSRNAYQIQLGFKISEKIEFLFLEDFAPFDTSPDVSFNLRIKF